MSERERDTQHTYKTPSGRTRHCTVATGATYPGICNEEYDEFFGERSPMFPGNELFGDRDESRLTNEEVMEMLAAAR